MHRSGKQVLDGNGTVIRLEGVNLGGWLMWEGWIWGEGFTAEKNIYNRIKNKVGQAATDAFRDSVYSTYITEADIAAIADQCHNVVRIPFNHNILEDDSNPFVYKQSGWNLLDSVLAWCERHDVYAVLDMHSAPGGQSNYFVTDPDSPNMWNNSNDQLRTAQLWKAIADRYKNRGIVAGYDLLNEPDAPEDSLLLQFYDVLIDSIRSVDSNHMLFIEGTTASTDFSAFTSLPDPNMLFAFHFYSWFVWNIPAALDEYAELANNMNVPVWCGEWGENNYTTLENTLAEFRDPDNTMSGSAFWLWKKHITGSNYPYYIGIDSSTLWNKSIRWIANGFNAQPTNNEMLQGMNEFLQLMRYSQCFVDDTMRHVLTSCDQETGISSIENAIHIQLFPNPTANQLTIRASSPLLEIALIDPLGKQLKTFTVLQSTETTVDLTTYDTGIYWIRITTVDGTRNESIVRR